MQNIPCQDFIGRVVTSEERIGFSFVDSYGHLSTCRYLELFVNHRMSAPEEQLGFVTMELVKQSIGLFIAKTDVSYLRPTYLSESVEIISWVDRVEHSNFDVVGLMYGKKDRKVRASYRLLLFSVDLKTGKSVLLPDSMPCRAGVSFASIPMASDVLAGLIGVPESLLKSYV